MLKNDGFDKFELDKHSVYGRIPLYPIDKVKLDKQTKKVIFYAKDVTCFAVSPSRSNENNNSV
jgi:hypothetical protein